MEGLEKLSTWFDDLSFFFASENSLFAGKLIIFYLAALWFAIIIWVTRDAIHRSNNVLFQVIASLLNIFLPIFGLILYLILRPEKTLLEKYHEDLEYRMLEGGNDFCFSCGTPVEEKFHFCPNCNEELHHACTSCPKKFSRRWHICPYCGTTQEEKKLKGKKRKQKSNK